MSSRKKEAFAKALEILSSTTEGAAEKLKIFSSGIRRRGKFKVCDGVSEHIFDSEVKALKLIVDSMYDLTVTFEGEAIASTNGIKDDAVDIVEAIEFILADKSSDYVDAVMYAALVIIGVKKMAGSSLDGSE